MTGREITKPKHLVTTSITCGLIMGNLSLNRLSEDLERLLVTRFDASCFLRFKVLLLLLLLLTE